MPETGPQNPSLLRLRLVLGDRVLMGPGKAQLLDLIRETGSISAAGRAMSMSYKRAWSLVDEMNAGFSEPLVESTRGGPGGGGARITEAGEAVLHHYRGLIEAAQSGGAADLAAIEGRLARVVSDEK
ncbi:winged helix-turn-helix domain-containing protein [Pararhodobacter sp.]|uniref:winged helix-turn-helix domain-containing protein n=1 Tax=Pararhodobacter sp. TaxID=2127056 RepID=UPI002AFEB92E|nr:LysR family transcriptional regulator [Pararhodobacter sp.]